MKRYELFLEFLEKEHLTKFFCDARDIYCQVLLNIIIIPQ